MTANERRLIEAMRDLLTAYESVLPGLRYIAVDDYEILNRAPLEARAAIAAVVNPAHPQRRAIDTAS